MIDKLSYSSLQTFKSCKRKWWFRKVAKIPTDKDYKPSEALDLGKSYHAILEACYHNINTLDEVNTDKIIAEHNQTKNTHIIMACVYAYLNIRKIYPLILVKSEYEIKHEKIIGYIDAILIDDNGWWILDLKTARTIGNDLASRLTKDAQLNLYASFAEDIAKDLKLTTPFLGCRYNVVTKPSIVFKKTETIGDYCARVKPQIAEFIIPIRHMNPDFFRKEIEKTYDFMNKMYPAGEDLRNVPPRELPLPPCNYSACFSYFSPCQYWSQCYGDLYSRDSIIEVIYGNLPA